MSLPRPHTLLIDLGAQLPDNATGSTGSVTFTTGASVPGDGETVILDDGVNPAITFEFDALANGVAGGNVEVDVAGTGELTADNFVAAVNSQSFNISADNSVAQLVVVLTNSTTGTRANTTITETAANVTKSDFTGGTGEIAAVIDTWGGDANQIMARPVNFLGALLRNTGEVDLTVLIDSSADGSTWSPVTLRAGGADVTSVTVAPRASVELAIENFTTVDRYLRIKTPDDTAAGVLSIADWSGKLTPHRYAIV